MFRINGIFKVVLGFLNIHDLMIFIFYKTCYKFVIILFHDNTIIYIQHDKNKDTYNVSFSSIKHSMAKIDFVMQVHFTRCA